MKKKNFIFILADDLGYADLGVHWDIEGSKGLSTSPRLDQLSKEGLVFKRSYSNSSVCSPTRIALMTGRWQYRLRAGADEPLPTSNKLNGIGLPPEHPTLASLLKKAGYQTALVGKWHLGNPPNFGPNLSGYDHFFGFHAGANDYFAHCNSRGEHDLWTNGEETHCDGYMTDLISKQAVDYIQQSQEDKPFFLSVHYSAPHWPWLGREDREESKAINAKLKHTDGGSLEKYRAMIHHMDEGIGWILDALEEKGLANDTCIIFTSDNGGERFSKNWPLMGQKMDLLEGGIRVPCIARLPGVIQPGYSETPIITMDWTRTILSIAGTKMDNDFPMDGQDLSPLFSDHSWEPDRSLYWRMNHRAQKAIIKGHWKYLEMEGISYLFNLSEDCRERANLKDKHPDIFRKMKSEWEEWNTQIPEIPSDANVSLVFDKKDLPMATF